MIKESKYIFRRILIGVGIVLVLSFFKSCNVKAWSFTNNTRSVAKSTVINNSDIVELKTYNYISLYQNQINKSVYWCATFNNNCIEMYFTDINFDYENIGFVINSPSSLSDSTIRYSCAYLSTSTLPKFYSGSGNLPYNHAHYYSNTYIFCIASRQSDGVFNMQMRANANNENGEAFYGPNINPSVSSSNYQWYSNMNWNYYNNLNVSDENIIGSTQPEFVSFHATKISFDNVLTGYSFRPEFSVWDTDKYSYSYKFGNSNWLSLTENEQNIRINANGTIYVQVKDKETNELIDTATFTITRIGQFVDSNVDYNIKITGEYRTGNQLNNSSSSNSSSIIMEYQLYIDYFPKSSILKYQYQYVLENNSLDSNSWETLPSSNNGSRTYVVSQNGTLYARILDSNDSVVYTATFTVNSIGKSALDNNSNKLYNFYDSIRNKIDFGGPIGSLVNIPITFLQTISNGFNGATGVCTDYNLGNLWGTTLKLPCVNVKKYLGTQLYTTIDIICACCMFYMMVKMLTNAYYKFLLMEHTPVEEHIGRDY